MNTANFIALCYADIFDYPLTDCELNTWSVKGKPVGLSRLNKTLINRNIIRVNDFFCLKKRTEIANIRIQRAKNSIAKKHVAEKAAGLISKLPFVLFVGITGALAMNNSAENDDIDFLIISRKNRLWTTRAAVVILLELAGVRRRPKDREYKNKICLNLFFDVSSLSIPDKKRNLYIAHEILQVMPLYNKGNTYEKFITANKWVADYLPVAWKLTAGVIKSEKQKDIKDENIFSKIFYPLSNLGEILLYKLQLWYMQSRRTSEIVGSHSIYFHPRDTQGFVMQEFEKRINRYFKTG